LSSTTRCLASLGSSYAISGMAPGPWIALERALALGRQHARLGYVRVVSAF
jgi:hypothetical protein